ncbi:MAG: hypothetical protein K2P93_05285 [Alphaproteobacteria bacterium]|nr:hypothetical protein [Alphaproteobacteria bacterium]
MRLFIKGLFYLVLFLSITEILDAQSNPQQCTYKQECPGPNPYCCSDGWCKRDCCPDDDYNCTYGEKCIQGLCQ